MVKEILLYGPSGSAASRSRRQSMVVLLPQLEQAGDLQVQQTVLSSISEA